MFGILLAAISSGLNEVADSIGKYEVRKRTASVYTIGFVGSVFGLIFLLIVGLVRDNFVFSLASLPTFIPRIILDVFQAHILAYAIVRADRGDFGLVRSITLPLLLAVDLLMGYTITHAQLLGIAAILTGVGLLFFFERKKIPGFWLLIVSALNAVTTISLFKYNITHFNSVEAEQSLVWLAILIYFFIRARQHGENPFLFLRRPAFAGMSISGGAADAAGSFAYLFAPASIVATALRASVILFSILSGRFYFNEKHFTLRIVISVAIVAGLILLTVQ